MVSFRGFNESVEADLVVSMRPWKQIRQFYWDRGSSFSGFSETEEADSAVSMKPQKSLGKWFLALNSHKEGSFQYIFHGLTATAEFSMTPEKDLGKWLLALNSRKKGSFQHKLCIKKVWLMRSQWDSRSGFGGLNDTAKANSAVSMRLQKQIQRDPGSGLYGLNETAEFFMTPWKPFGKMIISSQFP
jgi:hypothetical protein